jgi:two-component system NtrC family response regulator
LADDYDIVLAGDRQTAMDLCATKHPFAVLLDLGLPPHPASPEEGLATLGELLNLDRNLKVIVITGQEEKKNALSAVGTGAYDFLAKPVDVEELSFILRRACHVDQLEREYHELQRRLDDEDAFEGMIGTSPTMQQVFTTIRKVATTDVPVLVLGESGTGKEMVALAIHRRSTRKDRAFVPINCSAIPENLLESELFGHEKGAFTGAHVQRKGRVESAAGGTLFLDEIGELPLAIQVKILRFLQDGIVERVGGRAPLDVDTRVIAATNVDLQTAIQAGKFREDLYYRLAVVVLRLPPIRERANDLQLLARAFVRRSTQQIGREGITLAPRTLAAIRAHPWPGNVRELENRLKRAVIMAEGNEIMPADLELDESAHPGWQAPARTLREAREAAERIVIEAALRNHSGKISGAAADLEISRPTLYELMQKLGIQRSDREGKPTDAG